MGCQVTLQPPADFVSPSMEAGLANDVLNCTVKGRGIGHLFAAAKSMEHEVSSCGESCKGCHMKSDVRVLAKLAGVPSEKVLGFHSVQLFCCLVFSALWECSELDAVFECIQNLAICLSDPIGTSVHLMWRQQHQKMFAFRGLCVLVIMGQEGVCRCLNHFAGQGQLDGNTRIPRSKEQEDKGPCMICMTTEAPTASSKDPYSYP